MSNTLIYQITQKYEDSNEVAYDKKDYTISKTYTKSIKGKTSYEAYEPYTALSFGDITTGTALKITADQQIKIKLNGGTQEIIVNKTLILNGTITALSIKHCHRLSAISLQKNRCPNR